MFHKNYIAAIFSLALICMMLSACGGSSTNAPAASPTSTTAASQSSSSASSGSTSATTGSAASATSSDAQSNSASGSGDSSTSSASSANLLQVVQSAYYVNSDTKQGHVIGIVKNISGGDLYDAQINANVLDDSGATVGSGSSGSLSSKLFPADAQSGFDIVVNPTPDKSAKLTFSFDGQPMSDSVQPVPSRNLTVSDDSMSDTGLGNQQVTSTITNKGSKDVNNVMVVAAFLDDSGNVLDVSELVAGTDGTVKAGGTVKSMVGSTRSNIKPTKYLLFVSGMEN